MGKAYVIGVGMTEFVKPGSRDWTYPDMVVQAAGPSPAGRRDRLRPGRAGLRRLRPRRLHRRAARGLRAGPDRHPRLQREQQLRDRLDGAVHGQAVRRGRRLRRASSRPGSRRWRRARSPTPAAPSRTRWTGTSTARGAARLRRGPGHGAVLRQRRPRAHGPLRLARPRCSRPSRVKNHRHSVDNPRAQFRDEYTLDDVLASRMIHDPLTKLQCSPTSDGAAAAHRRVRALRAGARPAGPGRRDRRHGDGDRHRRRPSTGVSDIKLVGAEMRRRAAQQVYAASRPGRRGRRRHRAARLLQRQRGPDLRGARPVRARARAACSPSRAPRPTAASGS